MNAEINFDADATTATTAMKSPPSTVRHLVLSGGGASGLQMYGALSELLDKEFFYMSDIEVRRLSK